MTHDTTRSRGGLVEGADRLFARVRSIPFFARLTWFTRILLAAGFVPTGMVKLMGQRFTLMSVETPIGAFFEAMYQTGLYWRFLGASQVAAGLLLLFPRTAHLGAAFFLPVMVNIFVITVALGFKGTPYVTGLMLLAVVYLCAWDYDRFRGLITKRDLPPEYRPARLKLDPLERVGFLVFGGTLVAFFAIARGLGPSTWVLPAMAFGVAAGLFTLARFLTVGRRLAPSSSES